jgi:hypothetical protein
MADSRFKVQGSKFSIEHSLQQAAGNLLPQGVRSVFDSLADAVQD